MRLTTSTPSKPARTPAPVAPAAPAEESWSLDLLRSVWSRYGVSMSLSQSWRTSRHRTEEAREEREKRQERLRLEEHTFLGRLQHQAHETKVALKALAEAGRFERALKTAS